MACKFEKTATTDVNLVTITQPNRDGIASTDTLTHFIPYYRNTDNMGSIILYFWVDNGSKSGIFYYYWSATTALMSGANLMTNGKKGNLFTGKTLAKVYGTEKIIFDTSVSPPVFLRWSPGTSAWDTITPVAGSFPDNPIISSYTCRLGDVFLRIKNSNGKGGFFSQISTIGTGTVVSLALSTTATKE